MKHESEWREWGFQEALRFFTQIRSRGVERIDADTTLLEATHHVSTEHCDTESFKLATADETECLFSLVKIDDDKNESSTFEALGVSSGSFKFVHEKHSVVFTHKHELLGKGGYSKVYRGTLCVEAAGSGEKHTVAVKVTRLRLNSIDEIDRWTRVIRLWQTAVHPCLVYCHYIGVSPLDGVKGDATMYTVLEMASNGSLDALLKKKERFTEDAIRTILLDLLDGLAYLHNEIGVVHNDIKPQNILLIMDESSQRVRYKLSDFDAMCPVSSTLSSTTSNKTMMVNEPKADLEARVYGTPAYMSPESCRGLPFLPANDVWSVGILTYQLSTGRLPWRPLELQVSSMILYGYRQHLTDHFGPTLDEFEQNTACVYSNELKDLVKVCLSEKASERPSVSKLLSHPFFSSTNSLR